jgi:hypothetical protein
LRTRHPVWEFRNEILRPHQHRFAEMAAFARKTPPTIEEHLQMAKQL